ncbi:putative metal-binding protein, possibly nucleic-acid binding protein [Burkholderiales bacterium]|nr:putative metal-binding protein, possibly nucleic-acid binding protein [Burkholderiales bacterium]
MARLDAIDVFEMARAGSNLEGELALAAVPRLAQGLAHREGTLAYRCTGRIDDRGRPALALRIEALLPLYCDRCGKELDLALRAERIFYFVRSEAELAAIPIDDSADEALLGSTRFDLAALIEDEAILYLPISPRHPACQAAGEATPATPAAERRHPFAALAGLREHLRRATPAPRSPVRPLGAKSAGRRKTRRRSA